MVKPKDVYKERIGHIHYYFPHKVKLFLYFLISVAWFLHGSGWWRQLCYSVNYGCYVYV